MKKWLQELDQPIRFYGRIVDQEGRPVAGMVVQVQITQFSPTAPQDYFRHIREIEVTTDREGLFTVTGERGTSLGVAHVKAKHGYDEARFHEQERSFYYARDSRRNPIHVPDPKNPVVFRVRKRGEETFVLSHEVQLYFNVNESGVEKGMDVIRGHTLTDQEMKTMKWAFGESLACDLKAKAVWDPTARTWSVTLTAGTPGGGILASDQFLYEAPKEGYQPSLTWTAGTEGPKVRCLYLRSREPHIYTRLDFGRQHPEETTDIGGALALKGWDNTTSLGLLAFRITVNPFGGRNFEMDPDLNSDVREALRREVTAAYRFNPNGRPPEPDLPRLIKEAERKKSLFGRWFGK